MAKFRKQDSLGPQAKQQAQQAASCILPDIKKKELVQAPERKLMRKKLQRTVVGKDEHSWDQIIHCGIGSPAHASRPGFTVNKEGVSTFEGLVWRGTDRKPDEIFKRGFAVHAAKKSCHGRVPTKIPSVCPENGTTNGGVSASGRMGIGAFWAATNRKKEGYLYAIHIKEDPFVASIKANAGDSRVLRDHATMQDEFLLQRVKPSDIVAARKVVVDGKLEFKGDVLCNPRTRGQVKLSIEGSPLRFFTNETKKVYPSPAKSKLGAKIPEKPSVGEPVEVTTDPRP